MNHFTSPSFWKEYEKLPKHIQELADKNFEILKENSMHHYILKKWELLVGASREEASCSCHRNGRGVVMVLDWDSR